MFEGGKQSQGLCDSFASFASRVHAVGYPPNLTLKADWRTGNLGRMSTARVGESFIYGLSLRLMDSGGE